MVSTVPRANGHALRAVAPSQTLLVCGQCGHTAPEREFAWGERSRGTHPSHRYCPQCRGSIDWFGFRRISANAMAMKGEQR